MNDKQMNNVPDYEVQRKFRAYLRDSYYDERMMQVREGWLASRQIAKTSPQFLYPTPVPPMNTEGGEKR